MIRGQAITLRTVRESDLDAFFTFLSDIQNRGEYVEREFPSEVDFKKAFHEHGFWEENQGTLLICVDDRIVGFIGFSKSIHYFDGFELGYGIFDTADRNRGWASEAVSLRTRHLFAEKKINRLQLVINCRNLASKRVADKCGFRFEGTARGALFHDSQNWDMDIYSILRNEVQLQPAESA